MGKIVVVGASQGGVVPLVTIVKGMPRDFPAPILIALHIGSAHSILPQIFNDVHSLPAVHARQGEEILPGHVYVAPPDRHMVVTPIVDPLFRSAA
jgi:two-component system chemotaxis response regulator CheB